MCRFYSLQSQIGPSSVFFALQMVLVAIGVSSCSSEHEPSNPGATTPSWFLKPPTLTHKTALGGVQTVSFMRSQLGQMSLDVAPHYQKTVAQDSALIDFEYPYLSFSEADTGLRLLTTTSCSLRPGTAAHTTTAVQQTARQVRLLAALPLSVFRPMESNERWTCDLRFEVQHPEGVRHAFELKGLRFWSWSFSPVQLDSSETTKTPLVGRLRPTEEYDIGPEDRLSLVCPSWFISEEPETKDLPLGQRVEKLSRLASVIGNDTRKTERRPLCALVVDRVSISGSKQGEAHILSRTVSHFARLTFPAPPLEISIASRFQPDPVQLPPPSMSRSLFNLTVSNPNPFPVGIALPFEKDLRYRLFSIGHQSGSNASDRTWTGFFPACTFQLSAQLRQHLGRVQQQGDGRFLLGPHSSIELAVSFVRQGVAVSIHPIQYSDEKSGLTARISHIGLYFEEGSRLIRTQSGSSDIGWRPSKEDSNNSQFQSQNPVLDSALDPKSNLEIPSEFVFEFPDARGPVPFSNHTVALLKNQGAANDAWIKCWSGQFPMMSSGTIVQD